MLNIIVTYQFLNLETVLEESQVRSDSILTVVEESNHSFRVHTFTNIEFVVLHKYNTHEKRR